MNSEAGIFAPDTISYPENEELSLLRSSSDSPIDETLLGEVIGATSDYYAQLQGFGTTTQRLAELHQVVRSYCSERYSELKIKNPQTEKTILNDEPILFALNSVRKTLHQAMVRRHGQATTKRGNHRFWHS